jgi:hypothetical protein
MTIVEKYFYVTRVSSGWKSIHETKLVKWNPNFEVGVDEEVDYYQCIDLSINSLNQKDIEQPVSSEYEKVKSIIKQPFLDHYILALKYIHDSNTE